MARLISIGEAAKLAGVSVETLREWERGGKIASQRTAGGHRRYDANQFIDQLAARFTVPYARVSSHDQKEDLASDVLEIITVFSSRLYGSRSRKNLKIMQKLHEIPQEISPE